MNPGLTLFFFFQYRTVILHLSTTTRAIWRKGKGDRVAMRDVYLEQRLDRADVRIEISV